MRKDRPRIPEKFFGRPTTRIGDPRVPQKPAKKSRVMVVAAVVIVTAGLVVLALNYTKHATVGPKEMGVAPDVLGGYGLDGAGGDPLLNRLKNRISPPEEKNIRDFTIPQILSIQHDLLSQEGKRRRVKWYPSAQLQAEKYESMGARVVGYILRAKESGPESCNGYQDSLRDYHLWISDTPEDDRRTSMVVEVTPRWKKVHPEWRLRFFNQLAQQRAKVRVTGWLLWDEEHASEVEKSRGTQWEIHPITKFEVWSGNEWRELSGEFAAK